MQVIIYKKLVMNECYATYLRRMPICGIVICYLLILILLDVVDVQMAYKAEPRLHIYDDVCTQSWHILCSGTMLVPKNSLFM